MLKIFKTGGSAHEQATRRISLFSGLTILVMVLGVLGMYPNNSLQILKPMNGLITWFALFCVLFSFINLFNKEKVPGEIEFDNKSFFNLIFTLGMGVGILVFGFNESSQLSQYPDVRNPIGLTLNHWIVIPWCMYVTFTIFEIYDLKYNILPKWLKTVKVYLYGLMMMLGIGTSFALGVITVSDSIRTIWGYDIPSYALVILLGALVTISLLRGIHKGMKVLSNFSMNLLYVFIIILVIIAPSDTLPAFVESSKSFFTDFLYNNIYRGSSLQNDWTVYYWIWWLGWCAFTAPFIVTISRGRSIRQVVFFTVVIPSILITIYMVLGNNIGLHLLNSGTEINMIPFVAISKHWILPILFILLMCMFYVTSSDSQSYAMDCLVSKGSKTPVVYRKILWVFLEVLFVTVLLLAGSGTTSAVQGLSFLATPFMILFAVINVILIIKVLIRNRKIKSVTSVNQINTDSYMTISTLKDLQDYSNANQDKLYHGLRAYVVDEHRLYEWNDKFIPVESIENNSTFYSGDLVECIGIGYPHMKGMKVKVDMVFNDNTFGYTTETGYGLRLDCSDFKKVK